MSDKAQASVRAQPGYPPPQPPPEPGEPAPANWAAYDQYPPPSPSGQGRPWTIAGLVCGLAALFVAPIILGPLGITFGFVGASKGDRRGRWVGIGSIVTMIVGMALGMAVYAGLRRT